MRPSLDQSNGESGAETLTGSDVETGGTIYTSGGVYAGNWRL